MAKRSAKKAATRTRAAERYEEPEEESEEGFEEGSEEGSEEEEEVTAELDLTPLPIQMGRSKVLRLVKRFAKDATDNQIIHEWNTLPDASGKGLDPKVSAVCAEFDAGDLNPKEFETALGRLGVRDVTKTLGKWNMLEKPRK